MNLRLFFIFGILLFVISLSAENTSLHGSQPTGLQEVEMVQPASEVFVVEGIVQSGDLIAVPDAKEEKDSTEVPPKLEPMVLGGAAAVLLGTGAAVAGVFSAPVLLLAALVLFAGGAFLTARGWKKIKENPKLFKGEKLAVANYLVIGVVGVIASFYILYFLFTI